MDASFQKFVQKSGMGQDSGVVGSGMEMPWVGKAGLGQVWPGVQSFQELSGSHNSASDIVTPFPPLRWMSHCPVECQRKRSRGWEGGKSVPKGLPAERVLEIQDCKVGRKI